jgi:hypothetical protein
VMSRLLRIKENSSKLRTKLLPDIAKLLRLTRVKRGSLQLASMKIEFRVPGLAKGLLLPVDCVWR